MEPVAAHMSLLAQAPGGRQVLIWSAVLIGLVIVGYLLIMAVRKRIHPGREVGGSPAFTLHDLRRLHDEGKLTEEEYQRARERIVAVTAPGSGGGEPERERPGTAPATGADPASQQGGAGDGGEEEPPTDDRDGG